LVQPFWEQDCRTGSQSGVVALVCMNLPPSERYRPENMYLVTILPGPRESTQEQFNNLIDPLIDDFRDIWEHGIQYPGTATHPPLPVMSVLPLYLLLQIFLLSRKAVGAKPAATRKNGFCAMGVHTKNEEDDDDVPPKWWGLSAQEWRYRVSCWNESTTLTERHRLFEHNMVQWSPLLKLPYWDPGKFLVVDPMHNLFLDLLHLMFERVLLMFWEPTGKTNPNFWKDNSCGQCYGGKACQGG